MVEMICLPRRAWIRTDTIDQQRGATDNEPAFERDRVAFTTSGLVVMSLELGAVLSVSRLEE